MASKRGTSSDSQNSSEGLRCFQDWRVPSGHDLLCHRSCGRGPLDDQGIFVSVIVRNHSDDSKSHLGVKSLSSLVALPYLSQNSLDARKGKDPFKEPLGDSLSAVSRVHCHGDEMPVPGENNIAQDGFLLLTGFPFDKDQKGLRIKPVEVRKGRPVVGRFGKRVSLDFENSIQIGE